jgi:hypothetical protein
MSDKSNDQLIEELMYSSVQLIEAQERNTLLEQNNAILKTIVKNLSDDLAKVLALPRNVVDDSKSQAEITALKLKLEDAQLLYLRQCATTNLLQKDQVNSQLLLKEAQHDYAQAQQSLLRETEAHNKYEREQRERMENFRKEHDAFVRECKAKFEELNKKREEAVVALIAEKEKPKIQDAERIQKDLNWLVSQRNSLSRQNSDLFKVVERLEAFFDYIVGKYDGDIRWGRFVRDMHAKVKEQIYSGNKYFAPEYDELMYRYQLVKTSLTTIMDINNPMTTASGHAQITTYDIAKNTLSEISTRDLAPKKTVTPPTEQ